MFGAPIFYRAIFKPRQPTVPQRPAPRNAIIAQLPPLLSRRFYANYPPKTFPPPQTIDWVADSRLNSSDVIQDPALIKESLLAAATERSPSRVEEYINMLQGAWGPTVCLRLMHYCAAMRDVKRAQQVFARMEEESLPFTLHHFNLYLVALRDGKDRLKELEDAVALMLRNHLKPDHETMNNTLTLLSFSVPWGEAKVRNFHNMVNYYLRLFKDAGLVVSKMDLSMLLKIAQSTDDFPLGYKFYQTYDQKSEGFLDSVVFNQLFFLLRHSQLSRKQKLTYLQQLFNDMHQKGIHMNEGSFLAILPLIGLHGSVPLLDGIVKLLPAAQVPMSVKMYSSLIGAYASLGATDRIKSTFQEALATKRTDKRLLTSTVLAALDFNDIAFAQEVINIMDEQKEWPEATASLKQRIAQQMTPKPSLH